MKRLRCACCDGPAIGRQWHNRDTGFGLCNDCADWLKSRNTSAEEMHSCYGVEGFHYNISVEKIPVNLLPYSCQTVGS